MRGRGRFLAAALLLCALPAMMLAALSAEDIISPVEGTWSNVQALVINNPDGNEIYYSLSGTDPLVSGFSYDGPVVIDEEGAVRLRIAAIDERGIRSDFSVSYAVRPADFRTESPETSLFVQNISQNPIRRYVSGTQFSIPAGFSYTLEAGDEPRLAGTTLSLSPQNVLDRYVPCTVTDGTARWHFVIHVVPSVQSSSTQREFPFTIRDWTTLVFTDSSYIYQIDDEYWSAIRSPRTASDSRARTVDRSVPHVIRWQSVDFVPGNPVQSYVLPAKPALVQQVLEDGSARLFTDVRTVADVPFLLGQAAQDSRLGRIGGGLHASVGLDAFAGDTLEGTVAVGVYYGGLFQGDLYADCAVDKRAPLPPVITTTAASAYAREQVRVTLSAAAGERIFYMVGGPFPLDADADGVPDAAPAELPSPEAYLPYTEGAGILLGSVDDRAAFYAVHAYAEDAAGNRSTVAEYRVAVDEVNFYALLDGSPAPAVPPDGTKARPFRSLADAVRAVNARPYARLHLLPVTGAIVLDGEYEIVSDCTIDGSQNRLAFSASAAIRVTDARVTITDCILQKDAAPEGAPPLLDVAGGALELSGCELVGRFSADGGLLDGAGATLTLRDTGLTVQAQGYACALSALDCRVSVEDCRVTAVAPRCVGMSVSGGACSLSYSAVSIVGRRGQTVALSGTAASLLANTLSMSGSAEAGALVAVWHDARTAVLQDERNEEVRYDR